jgi:CPA2 family monovalent cation:H+ antiporter-2
VLHGTGIARASALVLAINDPPALSRAIRTARDLNPKLFILVRCRYLLEREQLKDLGAQALVIDESESGLQLATLILRRCGIGEGRILKLVARLRGEVSQRSSGQVPDSLSGYLSILDNGGIEFQAVPDGSSCIGKTLQDLDFRSRSGVTVVGLVRDQQIHYNVPSSYTLASGDTLLLLGNAEDLTQARRILHDPTDLMTS